jgi:glycosyltransferase involved in cell wall biosynthesis
VHRADGAQNSVTVVAHEIGPFGGMESQLAALVEKMLARGVFVTAIGRRIQLPAHENLCIVTVSGPARPFPIAYLWFFLAGTHAVARYRNGPVYTIGAIVLNRVDARKVPFCHAAWAQNPEKRSRASRESLAYRLNAWLSAALSRAAERIVYRPSRSGSLVAMSSGGAAELDELFPAMRFAQVIPNGVDGVRFAPDDDARGAVRRQLSFSEDELVCAFVGGDWRRKGLPVVIEALMHAPRWRLLVAGPGDRAPMLELAAKHGVASRITFAGQVDDPERYLAASDALAMPSRYEPWGNAVLEACASELPAVVAPAQGVNDFIESGVTGLVVEAVPANVAAALIELEDADLRRSLGVAARERAHTYSYDAVAESYLNLLLDHRAPRKTVNETREPGIALP